MPLIEIWNTNSSAILGMKIQTIVGMAGNGELKDGGECQSELRQFFKLAPSSSLENFAAECLENSFDGNGFILQDIVNEVGRRLGCQVEHGLYRGRQNQTGNDGLWFFNEWAFVVEIKTTAAYQINLGVVESYRKKLRNSERLLDDKSSCLIVVGRDDTQSLEQQLRGSPYNWSMRIVGVKALFQALQLKEGSEDPRLNTKIIEILKPREFGRIDGILAIAFDIASDRSATATDELAPISPDDSQEDISQRQIESDRAAIEIFKTKIAEKISQKFEKSLNRNRSSFSSEDDAIRAVIAVSKKYPRRSDNYWFACHKRQIEFLDNAKQQGFFVLGELDTEKAFLIPIADMKTFCINMLTTPPDPATARYYHVVIRSKISGDVIYVHPTQEEISLTKYEI